MPFSSPFSPHDFLSLHSFIEGTLFPYVLPPILLVLI